MSDLTNKLLGMEKRGQRTVWKQRFSTIADRLRSAYGVPSLGNFDDPIDEIFYIMLSARTTDAQYQKTYGLLREKFPTLRELAEASVDEISPCILTGGLAGKRAAHVKGIATRLLALGESPGEAIRAMAASEAFAFITGLPGMGPKSAFCVMMYCLGHDAFPVDINVQRIAARLGAIPVNLKHYQAQASLPKLLPNGRSRELHIGMVVHGRKVCLPRIPKCDACCIADLCNFGKKKLKEQRDHDDL